MASKSGPGSPIDLNSTRRAFPLDSRTVWVEQQIVMNGIVSKDNLFVSPQDYDPKIVERHVPVTTIARPKTVDNFHPYRGNTGGTNRNNSKRGSGKLHPSSPTKKSAYNDALGDIRGTLGANSRSEYVSVFSDHDKRMPIDPSRRYYITDKPALPVDPFLASRFHSDGPRGPDQLGSVVCQDKAARTKIIVANPQSDSVYETDPVVFKKRVKGGKFSTTARRSPDRKKPSESKKHKEVVPNTTTTTTTQSQNKKSDKNPPSLPIKNGSAKVSAGPPIKTRKQPVLEYDASCYQLNKKQGAINMTPKVSRDKAKVNVFNSMITTQRGYRSKKIESPLADRIRRNFM